MHSFGYIFRFLLPFLFLSGSVMEAKEELRLIIDVENIFELPRCYRRCSPPPPNLGEELQFSPFDLPLSGSAQFSFKGLLALMDSLPVPPEQILIIDLREESHGFMNDLAVSWYHRMDNWANLGLSVSQIVSLEQKLLMRANKKGWIWIYSSKEALIPFPFYVENAYTEEMVVTSLGMQYIRLPITDHCRPTDETVDQFISIFKTFSSKMWTHFHCAGGKGRASTFMVMYDCLVNANSLSLDEILTRQACLGGADLRYITTKEWKIPLQTERQAFIREFYLYCRECPNQELTWSEWLSLSNVSN